MLLRSIEGQWDDYRRGLRHPDQEHFDQLFEYADRHADAAGYLNADDPFKPVLVSMLLEQEKRLSEVKHRLEELDTSPGQG